MTKEPFYSIIPLVSDLYGIELDEDQFESLGMIAWNKIGNKENCLKRVAVQPEKMDNGGSFITKPCDMDEIEAITLPYEDCQTTSSVLNYPDRISRPIENWIESRKYDNNSLYLSGKLVNYNETIDKIYFNEQFREVYILYKSHLFDEDGLPFVNEKEKQAIATYLAYSYFYKKGLSTKDNVTIQMAQLLKKDWLKACDNARTPESVSQNDMKQVLDVMNSYDRHLYGKTSKIIK